MRGIILASLIFIALGLLAGCVPHYNMPMSDVTATPPDIIQKIPLNVAILIPDELENLTFSGGNAGEGRYTLPLGQMVKKNAFDMLSPAFNKAVLIKGKPYPQDIDAIIIPKFHKLEHWRESAGTSRIKIFGQTSIKLAVYNMKGMPIWEGIISSPKVPGKTVSQWSFDWLEATGSVSAESVVAVFQEAAKVLSSSREIHMFASAKGLSETIASKPSAKELPLDKSDIGKPSFGVTDRIMSGNDLAVIIGIEGYKSLPKSDYSHEDARLVKEYIKALGIKERNIEFLTDDNATKSAFEKSFEAWLKNKAKPDSRVFVYYSGHGAPDPQTGDAYLVPYDGDPNYLSVTGYPLKRLYDNLGKLQVKEVTVVLDSCFSGTGGRSVLAKGARPLVMMTDVTSIPSNMAVLAATQGTQISTSSTEKGHGVFTYYFLKALKDGKKTIAEIYEYIKPLVEDEAKQLNVQQSPNISPDVNKLRGRFSLRK